ncbi:DUF11 domain-containing protein [Clostridium paraputrificum]|uniref:DUF11 domain-containing protein n=1 Tax=Clostridium TaxID=1485 RepID=UPI003D350FDE
MQIVNQARTDFEYKLSQKSPTIQKTILSNKVKTSIIPGMLQSRKYTDKVRATLFETLTYTITITNISNSKVTNIYFQDILPTNLKFISNTLIINDKRLICLNPNDYIKLADIPPNNTTLISFKSLVIKTDTSCLAENSSTIYFDYLYNVEEPPMQLKEFTNTVITKINNNLFKCFNLESIVDMPYCKRVYKIINIKAKANIINCTLVQPPEINNIEDLENSLCTLVVSGCMKYEIIYQLKNRNIPDYFQYNHVEFFSTNIPVPIGISYTDEFDININVENIYFNIIYKSKLYISSHLILEIK